jgi:uncharacterized protein
VYLVFTTTNLALGIIAALIVGLSKTAIPGGGLLATPLFAAIVSGRLIAGLTLPVLLLADLFAVRSFKDSARRDVLIPLIVPVAVGFGAGATFFAVVGKGGRTLDVVIGLIVIVMVMLQLSRLLRPAVSTTPASTTTAAVGALGGFTTFVANAAGPVMNTYFAGMRLPKKELIGTSAVFYLAVNVAKVPLYVAIAALFSGGAFFTRDSLLFDLMLVPAVLVGVQLGRWLFPRIPQRVFSIVVLVLACVAAVRLLIGR